MSLNGFIVSEELVFSIFFFFFHRYIFQHFSHCLFFKKNFFLCRLYTLLSLLWLESLLICSVRKKWVSSLNFKKVIRFLGTNHIRNELVAFMNLEQTSQLQKNNQFSKNMLLRRLKLHAGMLASIDIALVCKVCHHWPYIQKSI